MRADVEGLHKAAGGGGDVEGGGMLSDEVRRRVVSDEVAAHLTHAHWALHAVGLLSSRRGVARVATGPRPTT